MPRTPGVRNQVTAHLGRDVNQKRPPLQRRLQTCWMMMMTTTTRSTPLWYKARNQSLALVMPVMLVKMYDSCNRVPRLLN